MNDVFKANGIIIGTSWMRSSNITDVTPVDFDKLVLYSDSTIRHWAAGNPKNELWTSCTASNAGGEGTWLNSSFAPQTAPNTGIFFSPKLLLGALIAQNVAGEIQFVHEIEFIVDFRGAK